MRFKIELDHPEDLNAYGDFLKALAAVRKDRPEPQMLFGIDRATNPFWRNVRDSRNDAAGEVFAKLDAEARQNGLNVDGTERRETVEAADAAAETSKPRSTRAKKTTTVADLPADVVAEAAAAGVKVEDESRIPAEVENQTEVVEETANEPAKVEEKPLTEDQVRNLIIDLLNEAQAANAEDPDARTKTLKPLLDKLGAQKISLIPLTEYPRVPGLIAEARAALGLAVSE